MVLLSCSAGVPQGSIFRPFCSLYVNDIPNHMLMIQYYMNRGEKKTKLLKLLQHYQQCWHLYLTGLMILVAPQI